jgi:hypothetical protein
VSGFYHHELTGLKRKASIKEKEKSHGKQADYSSVERCGIQIDP